MIEELVQSDIELFFLALPHGTAAEYAISLLDAGKKIIDLSADFRLNSPSLYKEFYGSDHPAPKGFRLLQYGSSCQSFTRFKLANVFTHCIPRVLPNQYTCATGPATQEKLIDENEIIINSIMELVEREKMLPKGFCSANEMRVQEPTVYPSIDTYPKSKSS